MNLVGVSKKVMESAHLFKSARHISKSKIRDIRIVSLNAQCGKKLDRIVHEFTATHLSNCDLILLQEIEEDSDFNQAETLAHRLGYSAKYMPARLTRHGTHGLAILSKHPLSDIERLELPRNELLINTRERLAMGATVTIGKRQLRVYNVHLDTRISAERRQRQLLPVVAAANDHSRLPTIIAGDFNTFSPRHTIHLDNMLSGAGFSSPFLAGDHYTAKFLFWRPQLDWIYSRNLRVLKASVEHQSLCSDHRPIWVDADLHAER